MNYQKEEKEFFVMDYVWRVLQHWRRIIICTVLFAVLACGAKYAKDIRAIEVEKKNAESSRITTEDIEKQIDQIPEQDRINTETAFNLIQVLKDKNSYVDQAAVMRLDPYNVDRIVLQYHIETDDYVSELLNAYCDACFSIEAVNEIVNSSEDTFTAYDVEDMISFRQGGNNLKIGSKNSNVIAMNKENTILSVTIRGENQNIVEQIAKCIKIVLDRYKVQAEKAYGPHSFILISESYENGKDDDIVDIQNSFYESVYYTTDRINNIKRNSVGEEAADIINTYMAVVTAQESNENSEENISGTDNTSNISISKKWLLLGAILGIMFGCGLELLHWIGGGKLNSANELQQNLPMKVLGVVECEKGEKTFSMIDKFIYKLKWRNKKCHDLDQAFKMLLSRIIMTAKKNNIQDIYVTGTEIEKKELQSFLERLRQAADASGIKLIIGRSINHDAEAFLNMVSIGNTIFIEETNVSIYQEIIQELQICEEQGVNILGSIVVEH